MRENLIYAMGAAGSALLVWNLHKIFLGLPDEAMQGAIYRIIFFHVPAAMVAGLCAFVALLASCLYLWRKNLKADAVAASVTEVAVALGTVNLITGMIWGRIIWGIWWTWDARLTSMLVSLLMYASYLILRGAIDEPTQRARNSAVLSIFTFPGVVITYKSIDWWRTQHPGAVLTFRTGQQRMDPAMEAALGWNMLVFLLFGSMLILIRLRQEEMQREIDAMRREAHAI